MIDRDWYSGQNINTQVKSPLFVHKIKSASLARRRGNRYDRLDLHGLHPFCVGQFLYFIMTDSTFHPAIHFVHSISATQSLKTDGNEANVWQRAVGENLALHTSAQIKDDELLVLADSPVFAHAVRSTTVSILEYFRRAGLPMKRLRIRTRPPRVPPPPTTRHRRLSPLTSSVGDLLQKSAASLQDDGLRAALLRLARHAQSKGTD